MLFLVLFLKRDIFYQGNAKQGKEESEDDRRKKKKSNCILDKGMSNSFKDIQALVLNL